MIELNDTTFAKALADTTGAGGPNEHYAGWMVQTDYGLVLLDDENPSMITIAVAENGFDWNYHWDVAETTGPRVASKDAWYSWPELMEVSPAEVLIAAARSTVRRRYDVHS